ncbi:three component ABC system middle component [Collimonas fungivorans]|uniref:three component ABC system middle component n=1 Tax=Collimonas fungivorans TaxID=158899 RepID=UPI003FA3B3D3
MVNEMSHGYVDRNLIQNSTLACFLLTSFVHKYEELTAKTRSPELMKLLLILPIVWHRESCDAIKSRIFSTPLQAVLADSPYIKAHLQERMDEFAAVSFQGLNLACATGLLRRVSATNAEPSLTATFSQWPRGSKPVNVPREMLQTIQRLATWFKDAPTAHLYSLFLEG